MTMPDTELTVNHKMIPAFVAYLAEILILFSLLVPVEKYRFNSISLWEASYGHEKFIYIFSSLFVICGIIFHLLEFGGPRPFRGKTIISLGLVSILQALGQIGLILTLNKQADIAGVYYVFVIPAIICFFAVTVLDIVIRSQNN